MSRASQEARLNARKAAEAARRRRTIAIASVVAVLLVVTAMIAVKAGSGSKKEAAATTTPVSADVLTGLASVPPSVLTSVGKGTATAPNPLTTAPALTKGSLPHVIYVGAEYCPFCAAERWSVVQALSRFGTFSGLGMTRSSASDVFPSTATLSFHGATYTSPYLSFTGYETETTGRKPLDTLPADVQSLLDTYDAPPYVPSSSSGAIPFIALGGKAYVSGAAYSPELLKGKSQAEIVAALKDPESTIAKAVLGGANQLTTTLCTLTGQKPANVCTPS